MTKPIAICWFRQDLRLRDNPALVQACSAARVLPIYVLDDVHAGEYAMGAASRWWLHHALTSLRDALGGRLSVYRGDPLQVILSLIERYNVTSVCWNRCYEPWRIQRDQRIKASLKEQGIAVHMFKASLLWEPWEIHKADGSHYKVFTPFYQKGCLQAQPPAAPLPAPERIDAICDDSAQIGLDALGLLPAKDWYQQLQPHWQMEEEGAHARLREFVQEGLDHYKEGRNVPMRL